MTVLVFGGNGQVGQELLRALAPLGGGRDHPQWRPARRKCL